MNNTLNYYELQDLCRARNFTVAELCGRVGITRQGLQSGLERQSLGVKYVFAICELLKITPNQFFRMPDTTTVIGNNVQQTGTINMQQIQDGMDVLHEQLAVKDRQIEQLLTLLNK